MSIEPLSFSGVGLISSKDNPTFAVLFPQLAASVTTESVICMPLLGERSLAPTSAAHHFCFDAAVNITKNNSVLDIFNRAERIGIIYDRLYRDECPLKKVKGAFLFKDENNSPISICIEDGEIYGDVYKVEDNIAYLRFYIYTSVYKLF